MKKIRINIGWIINKLFKIVYRPALRNCKIGRKVKIGTESNCIETSIDDFTYIGKGNSICNTKIGKYCSIASFCSIGGGNHPKNYVSTSPIFLKGKNVFRTNFGNLDFEYSKPVEIGNDVWIGEKVFIKDGIKIGNGVIIGAHSVVTHDVPAYAIVAGIPAKIISYRFNNEQIEKLEKIKWWENDIEKLKKQSNNFDSIELFLREESK